MTFTLTGFSTIRREEIQLPAAFTATVSVDLKVGALEETITVSGESPLVDTSNVIKRQVVSSEVIASMPTSKNWSTLGVLTVGVFSNQNDVGGSAGEHQNQLKAHGGSFNDRIVQLDGLMIANMACNYACTGISTNDASTQELSYEFGAISAETGGGGVRVNVIPREGGNQFSGLAFANFANSVAADQQRRRRAARAGRDDRRQHREDLRHQLRVRRTAEGEQAVVLDRASLLGLRADSHQHVLRGQSQRLRLRSRSQQARAPRPRRTAAWTCA